MGRRPGRARRLDVSPSLNRVVIGAFPDLPEGLAGRTANTWLAAWGIAGRMAERHTVVDALRRRGVVLPELGDQHDAAEIATRSVPWPAALDALVRAGEPAAEQLADDLGRALGALVATLVLGPADARAALPDWPEERWRRWAHTRSVAIGGGIVSGTLGRRLVDSAGRWLAQTAPRVGVQLVASPSELVLRGAALLLPGAGGYAVDSGSTTVKRAAVRHGGLVLAPPVAAPPRAGAEEIVGYLARVVGDLVGADVTLEPVEVCLAIATYVDERGQPYAGQQGPYGPLGDVPFVEALQAGVSGGLGREVALRVVHDGAAALVGARADDPEVDAVFVLGTSLGHALDARR